VNVLVSGSHGLIGSALIEALPAAGHRPLRLVRSAPSPGEDAIAWDLDRGWVDSAAMEGVGAAVHLAGEGIGRPWWTAGHKARVLDSRVRGTRLLAETIAGLTRPPEVFASASAVGFYGDRGAEILTEESPAGTGFLPEVCRQWEASTKPAEDAGLRVVRFRTGTLVLSGRGGALGPMLIPFRLGLGGRLGSGRQYWSWISIHDEVGAILHTLTHGDLRGPLNFTAPHPVTNAEFTRALAGALGRPAFLPVPSVALKVVLGPEMAEEMIFCSARVLPRRLLDSGYTFVHPHVEPALRTLQNR
jgi:uncharacterized protein (TIGR01777 family)